MRLCKKVLRFQQLPRRAKHVVYVLKCLTVFPADETLIDLVRYNKTIYYVANIASIIEMPYL